MGKEDVFVAVKTCKKFHVERGKRRTYAKTPPSHDLSQDTCPDTSPAEDLTLSSPPILITVEVVRICMTGLKVVSH